MSVTITTVEEYFRRYGWEYMEIDDTGQTILTGFIARNRKYTMIAILRNDWLVLTIKDFIPPTPPERLTATYQATLDVNAHLPFARFGLVGEDQISLIVDLPAADTLDFSLFTMAIDLMVYAVDRFYPMLYEAVTGKAPVKETKEPAQ